ncbi:AAA family ATPase [Fusobacterium polymorphum]|uniref:AAA family ATPase n=1 Tax=Fusobacterium nucleatum subsp. polymorphum TaxID=76857 RepID=UPI00300B2877
MLNKIVFEKLFGVFDYEIYLKEGGVTILTGPNGFGKSTILKSINAFYLFDITFFSKLDFKKILFFSSNFKKPICIEKESTNIIIDEIKINIKLLEEEMLKKSRKRISEDNWIDRRFGRIISKNEIIEFFFENNEERNNINKVDIKKLKDKFKKYSGDIKFIKEQRLLREETIELFEKQTINVIEELPNQFKDKMNQVSSKYSSEANRLDSSYPNRLFKTERGITKDEYEMSLESMNKKFEKLNKYNISDIKRLGEQVEFLEEHSKALKIYFDDFEKKYKVFEDFIEQLDLFTDIINSRLKFKEIRISREDGIAVYKSNTSKKNERLHLEQLSSGEKQEIILFYELIFESEKNIHLLIDEPEISLHIEWQLKFMDDLLRIAEKKKFKVTVATHSPQIINNHWDIQIDLGEMYGN